jgi:integrase
VKRGWPAESRTFWTKTEAKDWITKIEAEMNAGRFVSTRAAERMTLGEAIDGWAKVARTKLKHFDVEEHRINNLKKREIAAYSVYRVTVDLIEELVDDMLEEEYSPTTIRLYLSIISRSWKKAMKGVGSAVSPTLGVENLSAGAKRTRRLNDGEEQKLLSACEADFADIVRFALETGARRAEIANLEWADVSIKGRTALLRDTKSTTGKARQRTLPLSPAALTLLGNMPRPIKGGSVFGKTPRAITQCMGRARKKAKITDLRFHDLRHEAISRLFEQTDLSDLEIREISGHESMQMLLRYTHLRSGRLADRLAGAKRGADMGG